MSQKTNRPAAHEISAAVGPERRNSGSMPSSSGIEIGPMSPATHLMTTVMMSFSTGLLTWVATAIDSAALLTHRAAWLRDQGRSVTREAAMAKMTATENAQRVIDAAVQLFGGLGVVHDQPVERLYREIRALRIYEGATEVQKLIIGRERLRTPTAAETKAAQ